MNATDREHIIMKHLAGELTATEERDLAAWRQASLDHEALYTGYQRLWQASSTNKTLPPVDLDAEWERLRRRLRLEAPKKARIFFLRRSVWPYVAAAAVVSILVTASVWYAFWGVTAQPLTLATGNGETQVVTFADGSTTRLNSGSTLTYPPSFSNQERRVELEGEAFFEVTPGETPFVVNANNAEVRVLGTAFNVWARGNETRVAVQEGRVALEALNQRVEVAANQAAVRKGEEPPVLVDAAFAEAALAWLDGRIVFERAPLPDVVAELTRVFDQPIELRSASLTTQTITGAFTGKTLDNVLASLCLSFDCRYVVEEGVYVIVE